MVVVVVVVTMTGRSVVVVAAGVAAVGDLRGISGYKKRRRQFVTSLFAPLVFLVVEWNDLVGMTGLSLFPNVCLSLLD